MEPCCNGCGAKLDNLQQYWTLESHIRGRYEWHRSPGPLYCELCMSKMVFLLGRDFMHAASEEEG